MCCLWKLRYSYAQIHIFGGIPWRRNMVDAPRPRTSSNRKNAKELPSPYQPSRPFTAPNNRCEPPSRHLLPTDTRLQAASSYCAHQTLHAPVCSLPVQVGKLLQSPWESSGAEKVTVPLKCFVLFECVYIRIQPTLGRGGSSSSCLMTLSSAHSSNPRNMHPCATHAQCVSLQQIRS